MSLEEEFLNAGGDGEGEGVNLGGWGLDGKDEMPSMEAILQMIEAASGLSDEEKAEIKADVIKFNTEGKEALDGSLVGAAATAGGFLAPHNLLFIGLVAIIALILGFFVFKLIKTEKDKQKAKELKRIAKEQRRNKKKKT